MDDGLFGFGFLVFDAIFSSLAAEAADSSLSSTTDTTRMVATFLADSVVMEEVRVFLGGTRVKCIYLILAPFV